MAYMLPLATTSYGLHQPNAIVAVCNVIGGDHCPLPAVCSGRFLAVPGLSLRNIHHRIGEAPLVQKNAIQPALSREIFDLWESVVPVEVGIVHQKIARPPHTEHVQKWNVIRIRS